MNKKQKQQIYNFCSKHADLINARIIARVSFAESTRTNATYYEEYYHLFLSYYFIFTLKKDGDYNDSIIEVYIGRW